MGKRARNRMKEMASGSDPSGGGGGGGDDCDELAIRGSNAQTISKTAKRRMQKKRAKLVAKTERETAARLRAEQKQAAQTAATSAATQPHPKPKPLAFMADEEDHCETAPEAYAHIDDALRRIAAASGVTASALRIYDPYFCNGAVVRHLGVLGFDDVYNANEDFYAAIGDNKVPLHDVVVTNPPYSSDHPKRLLDFLRSNGKPWLALMPCWVSSKDYFEAAVNGQHCAFILPKKRYHYWTPRGRRADIAAGGTKARTHSHTNAALGARTSPFVSMWYCGGLPEAVRGKLQPPEECSLFWTRASLPAIARIG